MPPVTLNASALIADLEALIATEIFSSRESAGPLFKAAFAWLILNLHELLQEAERIGRRVQLTNGAGEDAAELIGRARYAIVHLASGNKRRGSTPGSDGITVAVGGASGFADDIAVVIGDVRVLIRRDAVRSFEAARSALRDQG